MAYAGDAVLHYAQDRGDAAALHVVAGLIAAGVALRDVCASSFDIHSVQRRTARHKQPISFCAAKTDVAADLGEQDLSDPCPIGCEDVNTVVPVTDPAGAGPNVTVLVCANPVGEAGLDLAFDLQIH